MKVKRRYATIFSFIVIGFCLFGFVFAPNDPDKVDLTIRLIGPSLRYPLGTDTQGRCLFSRILYGSQISVAVVLISVLLILIVSCPIGLYMGKSKKKLKWIVDTVLNAMTALPPIAYLMVFIGAWGNSIFTTFIALTLSILPRLVKLLKTKSELELEKAYVSSALVSGCSTSRLLFIHILPNCFNEIISYLSLMCAEMIMMITSFSFIGLGLGDDVKDLGGIIEEGYQVILLRNDIVLYPVIFVVLISLSFNLLGEKVK